MKYKYFKSFFYKDYSLCRLKDEGAKNINSHYEIYIGEDKWNKYITVFEYDFDTDNEYNFSPISFNEAKILKNEIDNRPLEIEKTKEVIKDRNYIVNGYNGGFYPNGFKDRFKNWFKDLRKYNIPFNEYINNLDIETSIKLSEILNNPSPDKIKEINKIIKRYNSPFLADSLKIIKHLPYVSLEMPINKSFNDIDDFRYERMDDFEFQKYNFKMSDIGVDRLFKNIKGEEIIPKYSRLYCDVEKYLDDKKEIMSRYGMGVIYKRMYDNKYVGNVFSSEREKIIDYYKKYHEDFKNKVNNYLDNGYNVLILDLHSFSEEEARVFTDGVYPDICIGIDDYYKDDTVTNYIINEVNRRKLSYKINFPYSGSFVPKGINKEKAKGKLVSIMIEVNKKLYL